LKSTYNIGGGGMMENINELGQRLKELRQERDLTLDMVVYDMKQKFHIEITKGNLSRWENNINTPSLRLAAYLCLYYNISLDYLIGNTDVKAPVDLIVRGKKKGDNDEAN
jgi:transcriptional regulator with XRE-family HTH domain